MSPLVRSLLALAALLTTAATQPPSDPPPPNCTEETFGQVTPYPVPLLPVTVPSPGGTLEVKGKICPDGYHRVGETVRACNNNPNGLPPLVNLRNHPDLDYVDVRCTDGCPYDVTATVTVYCAPNFSQSDVSLGIIPVPQKSRRN